MSNPSPAYFDYLGVAQECRLTQEQIAALERIERGEFPDDQMMVELHMLRLLHQIRAGHLKLEDVLASAG